MPGERLQIGGTLADRYVIEAELHRSSSSRVYRARDRRLGRAVAVKLLRAELAAAVSTQRFLRSIALAAPLQHPHILPIFDAGQSGRLVYYVSPLVEGENLEEHLRRVRQLPLGAALSLAGDVADALAYAHAHGVVHRDIAPRNILISAGHAVVADFGIARGIADAGDERITPTGIIIGSPPYMSPEQYQADAVDGRADIYSLGCVLFELLVGRPPFSAVTPDGLLRQHLRAPVPLVRPARPDVPDWVDELIARAMAKRPADRFASAEEMGRALRHGRA